MIEFIYYTLLNEKKKIGVNMPGESSCTYSTREHPSPAGKSITEVVGGPSTAVAAASVDGAVVYRVHGYIILYIGCRAHSRICVFYMCLPHPITRTPRQPMSFRCHYATASDDRFAIVTTACSN